MEINMNKIWINVFQQQDSGFSRWINMGYLKAALQTIPDVEVKINFYRLEDVDIAILDALQEKPTIIGLTVLQFNYYSVVKFAEKLKETLPQIHITLGNTFASTYPVYLLEKYKSIDSIVIGEGEYSLVELCERVLNGTSLKGCKGTYYREGSEVHKNEKRVLRDNLDDYPMPDRSFCEYRANIFGVLGSRGCYGNCTFCDINTLFKDMVRVRSINNILDEIEFLVKEWNAKYITFYDSTFCVNKIDAYNRLEELYYGLLRRNLHINFSINLRSEQMDDRLMEIIQRLKSVGLDYLMFGFEAGNDEDLVFYGKPSNVKNHLNTLRLLRENKILSEKYDISISYGFINFHPYSKIENIKKNLLFLQESGLFVTFEILNTRFLNFGNGYISKKIEKDGLLLSPPEEPIVDPIGYKFVEHKIQTIYDITCELENYFSGLKLQDADEWISVYRRWSRFFPHKVNKYQNIFETYIEVRREISQLLIEIMWNVINDVEQNRQINSILEHQKEILYEKMQQYKNDCEKFNIAYQKFNVDLYKINEALVR